MRSESQIQNPRLRLTGDGIYHSKSLCDPIIFKDTGTATIHAVAVLSYIKY